MPAMADAMHAVARPKVAAGAVFFDEADRVMLVRPSYKPHWDIPGGYVEPGESPRDACEREVHEELSIRPAIGRLLVVDWAPHPDEGDKLLFVFDGGTLSDSELSRIRLDPAELLEYRFHEVASLAGHVPARMERRVAATVDARDRGQPRYLEHGRAPMDRSQAAGRGSAGGS